MNWIGFANPWLLAALAAAGLPVLVHYLTRARPRRIVFPPFRFLVEACAGQQALHRLRTIILLTLRCLALLALALLFARPFLKPTGPAAGRANQKVVLVVDASLSMRALQQGVPLFARAQADAAEVLRGLESGAEAGIVLIGSHPRLLLPALSRNTAALHDSLVRAQASYELGDPAGALAAARKMLGEGGAIYIFSDFQQSNWEKAGDLPSGVECRLRPVTTTPVENLGITGIRVSPAAPVAGEPVEFICTVLNSSSRPRQETVRLQIGGLTREAQVAAAPFSPADVAFNFTFPQVGMFSGKATISPDDLREDDTRFVAVRVHKAMQLLVVSDTEADDTRSAAFFISRALAPSAQAAPGLQLVRRHSQDADRGVLETADAFVIVAPAALSGEALEVIARRVNEGAELLVFLDGPASSPLAGASFSAPFQVIRAATSGAEGLVPGLQNVFEEADGAPLRTLRVRRYLQTQTLPNRQSDLVLAYPDGSAALTLSRVGKGGVVFANVPLTPDGTDFIGHPLFPSLLHDVLRALRRGDTAASVAPGMAWTLESAGEASGISIRGPDARPVRAQVIASGATTRLAIQPVDTPGIYEVRQADKLTGAEAINSDPRESDTRPLALEKLKAGAGTRISVIRNDGELLLAGNVRPLWPLLAGLAAVFIAGEMVLLAFWRTRNMEAARLPQEAQP